MAKVKEPSPEEFSGQAIRNSVLKQTLRHPLTVLPTGLAAVTAVGSVVVGPPALFLGGAMLLGSMGFGAWAVNYFLRPKKFADRYVAKLEKRRDAANVVAIQNVRKELRALGSVDGVKEWDELVAAHEHFQSALKKREAAGVALDVSTLRDLADRTLKEGRMHLGAYLSTLRALRLLDAGKLSSESKQLKKRIKKIGDPRGDNNAERTLQALQGQLQAIEDRLLRHREETLRLEEILAASERCEAVLETGALNLATMREVTARFVEDASAKLEETVAAAHRFNQTLGQRDDEADRIYDRVSEPAGERKDIGPTGQARRRAKERGE